MTRWNRPPEDIDAGDRYGGWPSDDDRPMEPGEEDAALLFAILRQIDQAGRPADILLADIKRQINEHFHPQPQTKQSY